MSAAQWPQRNPLEPACKPFYGLSGARNPPLVAMTHRHPIEARTGPHIDWNIMTRSEIQLIVAMELTKLFIERQISHYIENRSHR